jgi:pyrroline-5-carboxylate reductase
VLNAEVSRRGAIMDIGFVGLGGMGRAIAINLLRAGHG